MHVLIEILDGTFSVVSTPTSVLTDSSEGACRETHRDIEANNILLIVEEARMSHFEKSHIFLMKID